MKLEVEDDKIVGVEMAGVNLPLRKPLDISKYDELKDHVEFLEKRFDLSKMVIPKKESEDSVEKQEWTREELENLLANTTSARQELFFKKLSKNPKRLTREKVRKYFKRKGEEFHSYTMPGLLSGIQRRANNFGKKERFFESKYDGERYYFVKEKYRGWLKDYFFGSKKGEN